MSSATLSEGVLVCGIVLPSLLTSLLCMVWLATQRWSDAYKESIVRHQTRESARPLGATDTFSTQAQVEADGSSQGWPPQATSVATTIYTILPGDLRSLARAKSWSQGVRLATIIASLVSLTSSCALWGIAFSSSTSKLPLSFPIPLLPTNLYIDSLSMYFLLVINVVAFLAASFAEPYLESGDASFKGSLTDYEERRTFHLFFNLFHTTMLLVCLVDNVILLWIFIQLTTVCSAPLVGFVRNWKKIGEMPEEDRKNAQRAQEAAWKYILISSAGILFALLGTILLVSVLVPESASTGAINWSSLYMYLSKPGTRISPSTQPLIELAFLFVVIGYGTKAGLFPMQSWLPDAHGQSPYPVSALLSGVLLKSALYAILRLFVLTNLALNGAGNNPQNRFASIVLLVAGLISLLMAVPFIVNRRETPFKRVLAYHSLEHMGIITFGFGLGVPIALFGALLHTLNHALTKALMFLTYGGINSSYTEKFGRKRRIHGVLKIMPAAGAILAFGGLALVGAPPFNIFLSEFLILWGGIQATTAHKSIAPPIYIVSISLFVLSISLIFAGLVQHLGRILLRDRREDDRREDDRREDNLDKYENESGKDGIIYERFFHTSILALLLLLITYFGFTTAPLTGLISGGVQLLCTGVCHP